MSRTNDRLHDEDIERQLDEMLENDVELEEGAAEVDGEKAASAVKSSIDKSAKKKQAARKGDKLSADDEPGVLPGAGDGSDTPGQAAKLEAKHAMKKEEEDEDEEDEDEDDEEEMEESVDFSEDLDALVSSEATLSESFREKAALIFESAFNSKVEKEVARLEEQYQEAMVEEVQSVHEDLVQKIDSYLNYVVENWMEENKLAVETGLRADIAESFMKSLQSVFTEHYIEVPEGKENLVDTLATRVEDLEESVSDLMNNNIELKEQNGTLYREAIIREQTKNLSDAQAEKLIELAESTEYQDKEDFSSKVAALKESYFGVRKVVADENAPVEGSSESQNLSPMMEKYLAALRTN